MGCFRLQIQEGSIEILAHTARIGVAPDRLRMLFKINSRCSTFLLESLLENEEISAIAYIATSLQMLYTFGVEYPFPPVGIVGAADGKNRRAFFFLLSLLQRLSTQQLHNSSCNSFFPAKPFRLLPK